MLSRKLLPVHIGWRIEMTKCKWVRKPKENIFDIFDFGRFWVVGVELSGFLVGWLKPGVPHLLLAMDLLLLLLSSSIYRKFKISNEWDWVDCSTFITSPRHSSAPTSNQTFITPKLKSPQSSDIHHPLPKIRHSSPQTFITSDIHHLRWWTSEVMNVWIDMLV